MEQADYIIIGGGIMGCALFYELAKASAGKIILLEQGQVASGTTGQSGGFIRKINSDPYISQLSRDSFDYYQSFKHDVGEHCGFVTTGLTYTLSSGMLSKMQNNLSELSTKTYPIKINKPSSDIALVHELSAGFIDTKLTCNNWMRAAIKKGARCYEHVSVNEILIRKERVYGVNTTEGLISSNQIIIATGALSRQLLSPLGMDDSLSIKSFQYHIYPQATQYLETAHLNMLDQFYLFPLNNGDVLAGFLNKDKAMINQQFDDSIDESLAASLHRIVSTHFPWISNTSYEIKKSYDAYTQDHYGLIKKSSIEGLFLATGLSSGGIKITPALAKQLIQVMHNKLP